MDKRRWFAGGKMKCSKRKTLGLCWGLSTVGAPKNQAAFSLAA